MHWKLIETLCIEINIFISMTLCEWENFLLWNFSSIYLFLCLFSLWDFLSIYLFLWSKLCANGNFFYCGISLPYIYFYVKFSQILLILYKFLGYVWPDFEIFFSLSTFFLYCLAREVLPECKKIKIFFLQILVLITSISNFNYKNQEKIFLKKSLKHMWQHQIHALEV